MSRDYITTLELIDELTAAGFRASLRSDSYGTFVGVYDDGYRIGGARVELIRVDKG